MGHRPQIYHSSGYRAGRSIRSYFLHGPMRIITLIIIHCSATPQGVSLSFEDCRHDHIFHRNFRDIGYHFYLTRDGEIHRGRPLDKIGAHCQGHNRHSIGICYEGGLDCMGQPKDTRTCWQKHSLRVLILTLLKEYPDCRICGHRDLSPDLNGNGEIEPEEWIKACPCFNAEKDWDKV